MDQRQLALLAGSVVVMAVAMILIGMSRRGPAVHIDQRLAHFAERPVRLVDEEMSKSFVQRVGKPLLLRISRRMAGLAPKKATERTAAKLSEAGNPSGLGYLEFMGLRVVLAIGLSAGSLFLFTIGGNLSLTTLLVVLVTVVLGYLLPSIWLGRKIKQRKKEIVLSLPDAIDLLTISVESGLGFDQAMMRVAEKWDNALTREFARVLSEMRIGKQRREAMREMASRVNVEDLRTFIGGVVQADQLGVPISQVLRVQSEAMRVKRRQRAEEMAHKAPIKMLFPMVFLIFPALYVVILGPALPRILESLGR